MTPWAQATRLRVADVAHAAESRRFNFDNKKVFA